MVIGLIVFSNESAGIAALNLANAKLILVSEMLAIFDGVLASDLNHTDGVALALRLATMISVNGVMLIVP